MILNQTTMVEALDCTYLTNFMVEAGFPDITVTDFQMEPAGGMSHGGGFVYRFRLTYSGTGANRAPRSFILKESRNLASQAHDPGYARREAACYRNGLFRDINEHLSIPKAYCIITHPESGLYWIWMEDLGRESFDVEWSQDVLVNSIRDIAELHAKWWERTEEFENMPFLRRRAQAMYDGLWVERIARNCGMIEGHPQAAQISRVFTEDRQKLLQKLSKAEDIVYPKLEALPQTLLHHDIWLPNLGSYQGKTVLIDWSYVGQGTPGADLSQTVALLVQMWDQDNLDDELLLQALWSGLKEDWGIPVDYEDIRAGYELTFCLRPAHALGGPILGSILSGKSSMVGVSELDRELVSAEATMQRVEKGVIRLNE